MRRLLTLLICLTMLIPALPATAEAAEQRLVIAITSEESALNLPLEEAFFKANPGVTVEYRLYSSNQLDSLLMTNQADFDMIILGYAGLMDMVEKDYLLTLDQIGMETYPAKLLDVSELLTYNGKLFALPISIRQEAWFFHYELSEQNNIEYPAKDGVWTWDEYLEFSKQFPLAFGENGEKHLYMMTGTSLLDFPSLQNIQVEMFTNYLRIPLIIAPKPSTSSPRPKFREKAQFKRTICTRNKPRYATFIRLRARYKFASANSVQQC